jgi:hypothetical protein
VSSWVRWWFVLACALLPCVAQAQQVHLDWAAPVGSFCPTGTTLSTDVEQMTGQRFVKNAAQADVLVVGRVERGQLEVVARIEAHTEDGTPLGTRELRAGGEDCASLRRPLAMVLALLLDQPVARARAPLWFAGGVEVALDTQLLPAASGTVGLLGMLTPSSWLRVRAELAYAWPRVAETERGQGATLQALQGALALCPRLAGNAKVGLWFCAGGQAGRLFAASRGLVGQQRKSMGAGAAFLELALSWQLTRLGTLWASGGAQLSVLRPELYFARSDESRVQIHRASTLGAILRIGLTIGGH